MNDLLVMLGAESWKPVLRALLFPPAPLILIALAGAMLLARRRIAAGWTLTITALVGLWALSTAIVGDAMIDVLTRPPPALSSTEIKHLQHAPKTAIVVLGAGRRVLAPEYGVAELSALGNERLRYGLWLARRTGLPVAFSGGVGHGAEPGQPEAEVARQVAERDHGQRLRWIDAVSRDTRENALRSVTMLRADGIERIVLVTHDFHMRRALAAFERALLRAGARIELVAAPMGLPVPGPSNWGDWMPSAEGLARCRFALHEWIGRLAGA